MNDLYKPTLDVYGIIIYVHQEYLWIMTLMELLVCVKFLVKYPSKEITETMEMVFFRNIKFSDYDSKLQIPILLYDTFSEHSKKIASLDCLLRLQSLKIEKKDLIDSYKLKIDKIFKLETGNQG